MSSLLLYHSQFFEKVQASAQVFSSRLTALPTYIFLLSAFVFVYQHVHASTSRNTKWKVRVVRDLKFHWIYFNATRLWFIFISCVKRLLSVAEEYIEMNIPEKDKYHNLVSTYVAAMFVVGSLALVPAFLTCVNYLAKYDMPNFLMWVMEDPYLRHEIGVSGRCLERPMRVDSKRLKNYPYRSRRSTSFDHNPWVAQKAPNICRSCKSMIEHSVVSSVEEMINQHD